MIPKINEIITNGDSSLINDIEIDTKSDLSRDYEKQEKIMPPTGLPVKKKIGLKRGYLDPEQEKKIIIKETMELNGSKNGENDFNVDEYLNSIDYNPTSGAAFSSLDRLIKFVKKRIKIFLEHILKNG